jgi:magnesium chelatase subunit I
VHTGVAEGDDLPVVWLSRDDRYVEKLATPDVTIADMVGDIDPIKAAQGGLDLADELTMHYGLLPRANRGIFAINELPDLAGKIQVGLFNIPRRATFDKGLPDPAEAGRVLVFRQTRKTTRRGKIITPLKDRIGSEIRTHYPATRHNALAITRQEAWTDRTGAVNVRSPITCAKSSKRWPSGRADRKIDKRSGVSQRLPITTLELVVSNAERHALANNEGVAVPRVTDVMRAPSITGKFEPVRRRATWRRAVARPDQSSVGTVSRASSTASTPGRWSNGSTSAVAAAPRPDVVGRCDWAGAGVQACSGLAEKAGLPPGAPAPVIAAAIDFVLEGLYAQKQVSRSEERGYAAAETASRRPTRREEHDGRRDSMPREEEILQPN